MLFISVLFFCVTLFFLPIAPLLFNRIVQIILFYSILLVINVFDIEILFNGYNLYCDLFQVNQINLSFDIILFIISIFILNGFYPEGIITNNTINHSRSKGKGSERFLPKEYPLLIIFTILGQCFLIISIDFISIFLSIELQSFALYILCSLYRESEDATSAGLKYFLLGGLSSAVILLGISIIYNNTINTQFEIIHIVSITNINNQIILGFVLILTGLLFKIAGAPFHSWAVDVYDGCTNVVTSWISTIPKISIIIFIINILFYFSINLLIDILLYSSVLSLIIGTVLGLSQYKIKRLLAYSSISHIGFILLCLCQYKEDSVEALLFYIFQYSVTNVCTFLCLLAFGYSILPRAVWDDKKIDIDLIEQVKGQFIQNPIVTISFSICLFSIAGIPPIIGFFAKQIALYSSINEGFYFVSIIAISTSVISASYYLKIVIKIHETTKSTPNINNIIIPFNSISNSHSLSIAILTIFIVFYQIKPQLLLNSTTLLSLYLFSRLNIKTLLIFLFFIPVLVFVLLLLNLLLAPHIPDVEKVGPYECGFSIMYGQTREKFNISFYTVGVLFIIFDLEILLLYPLSVTLYEVQKYGFTIFFLFFIVLTVGFIFEFGSGTLNFTNHKSDLSRTNISIVTLI